MPLRPIRVECYAGSRSDETPRRITVDGREYVVARILAESVEVSSGSNERSRRYKVQTEEGMVIEVVRTSDGAWRLVSLSRE